MIRVVLTLAAPLFVLAPAAHAEDIPARKPGLWEITMNVGEATPRVVRYCIDAATDAAMRDMGQATTDSICRRHDVHRDGATLTNDSVCRIGSSEVTSHSVTTFTADTSYILVMKSHYDPPTKAGLADTTTTQNAKWVGPCGADMKPGDMIVQGMKMHIPSATHGATP